MEFNKKEVELKDGTKCILKSPNKNDAKDMIEYLKITSGETHFMNKYPEEIEITLEEEKDFIKDIASRDNEIMIAAFINNELAGNAALTCMSNNLKLKHRAVFGISIKEKYWNNGIGSTLIKEIIKEAKKMGYEQIELGVFSDNEKARRLYERNGFEVWGKNKNAFKLKDGRYCDEIIMGIILQE